MEAGASKFGNVLFQSQLTMEKDIQTTYHADH